jgi:hypothetical protein
VVEKSSEPEKEGQRKIKVTSGYEFSGRGQLLQYEDPFRQALSDRHFFKDGALGVAKNTNGANHERRSSRAMPSTGKPDLQAPWISLTRAQLYRLTLPTVRRRGLGRSDSGFYIFNLPVSS